MAAPPPPVATIYSPPHIRSFKGDMSISLFSERVGGSVGVTLYEFYEDPTLNDNSTLYNASFLPPERIEYQNNIMDTRH